MINTKYWEGFIMADGCITKGSRGKTKLVVELKEEDFDHLVKLNKDFNIGNKIDIRTRKLEGDKFKSNESTSCKLSTMKPDIISYLSKRGIIRAKTFTCFANKSQTKSIDFWRGILDGDGCLMYNFSKAKNNYIPIVVLTTGSEKLIKQYQEYLKELGIESNYTTRKNGKTFDLKITHRKAHKLVTHLYSNAKISLDRKQRIADKIMAHYTQVTATNNVYLSVT